MQCAYQSLILDPKLQQSTQSRDTRTLVSLVLVSMYKAMSQGARWHLLSSAGHALNNKLTNVLAAHVSEVHFTVIF